ncbi:shugoshin-1 isoform X1 [Ziziphus jujuba]|uniref:Shugoshin-1 isoform X1 n=1 Tax=Ziziphus jujuba TaxID=326968 RepID=A0A6P3Z975_ZIZJJ|nr:shugoshin-1 isoform X1 [Ziziphus jujuba]
MKGERMAKRASFGSIMRKKLSDITNSQATKTTTHQEEKPQEIYQPDKDYVDQLIRERITLMKLLAERNKIIELSGEELQKMRASFQKLQLQNWNLAQSNSQMLAELHLGREKVKALQHELLCKDALLRAKKLELEGKAEVNCHNKIARQEGQQAALVAASTDDKPCSQNRRRTTRSRSMGSSSTCQKGEDKDKVENKRRCLRRQSARFKSHEREPGNLFEIDDVKISATEALSNPTSNEWSTPLHASAVKEEKEEEIGCASSRSESGVSQRSSIGRPLRRAVEKVQSYKEVPLNVKMRRKE